MDKPVLVLTEYWNGAIWHILGESFGRLAPHLESIKSNPDVLLHLSHDNRLNPISKKALDFFDIDASRVVLGNVVAPIVLFPEPTVL